MAQTFTEAWDVTWKMAHERVRSVQISSAGDPIDATFAPGRPFKVKELRITINTSPTSEEDFTMVLDSSIGSTHDMLMLKKDLTGLVSYNYLFDPHRIYSGNDQIVLAWANTEARTVGIELIYVTGS